MESEDEDVLYNDDHILVKKKMRNKLDVESASRHIDKANVSTFDTHNTNGTPYTWSTATIVPLHSSRQANEMRD